ncbi:MULTISPECIES: hypothetical protein [unclassified Pseudonocardia]|uniref:hypothetical protein n=1 Tax=unclassified Pseudonocardia TaxID=2619320 RepID=UPI0001FFDA7F|nr:hypothetical protein [Pseudonocardia sp. Ae707_Ps1]OLM21021.1 hypothetical protein Ae707Ps1_5280c [Pseudonocardia sp. Ae707_Ps1]
MPEIRAQWVTSTCDGVDHLVPDGPTGERPDSGLLRTLCGRLSVPAAMSCPPLPSCPECRQFLVPPSGRAELPARRAGVWGLLVRSEARRRFPAPRE